MTDSLRVISYGGGVQSTALLVLANQGRLGRVDAALFSNVGDDSEHPATLEYVRTVASRRSSVPVIELKRQMRDGSSRTLYEDLTRESRTINIPVRMANGAPGNRNCTATYKIQVIAKWLKAHGATETDPADVLIGISTDEVHRINSKRAQPFERPEYPLVDLNLDRSACQQLVADYGWPVPPKSSCYFCPFHRPDTWAEMRRDEPELFWRAADLEAQLIARRERLGKDPVYLTRFNKPLADAIGEAQEMLPLGVEWDQCDSGHCMT